ncbi:retinitis pigmentosa 9 protein isoform X2 [Loxodonta africana]|uniref:retinitis pigmentosa 9 protein isoform X4 n=1 Tax=Elephas maximus indicus TaxID=99487 RepID=UPI0021170AB1|nr:retinitis pigmentosa 9 protein isoform X4 [Elephas maximus indicus]
MVSYFRGLEAKEGPVRGPGGLGEDRRGGERQRLLPGGGGGAGPVYIHLEEEDGAAEDEDHRDVMKNLLLGLSRKMRLSQKTVYQMYQAMNMPGNFWLTHLLKDCGCHWGKKSKLCSAHEDPMYDIIRENKRHEKDVRIQQLKQLLEDSTSDEDGSSSSSSECKEKHKKKKKKEKHKKRKKEKKKKKKRKHKSSKSNESSDSD